MSADPRVSATDVSPPTDPLRWRDDPDQGAGAPAGTGLVPAPPARGERPTPPPTPSAAPPAATSRAKTSRPKSPGRTTRVVLRRLDPWSVLRMSIVYYLALFLMILVAGTLLWLGASAVGVIGNIESFMVDIGFEDFRFIPSKLLGGVALGGLVLVVAGTVANVIMCALFNLMGDVTGGLKLTLQEDVPKGRRAKDAHDHSGGGATV